MLHRRLVISRRALLGAASLGVLGAGSGKAFAQTLPENDLDSWPADAPGLLARTRLKPDVVVLMTNATRFSARRRRELSPYVPPGVRISGESATVPSGRFGFSMPHMGTPKPDEAQMARRLAGLILHDDLWTETDLAYLYSKPFQPDFVFNFADTFPGITLSICPAAHLMHLEWTNEASHAARTDTILLDPVGREMTAFIKAAFPGDPAAQSLVFTPETPKPLRPPITSRPPDIPTATWNKIRLLKPGMTRGDLLEVFETQGGGSSRLGRSYIVRNRQGRGPHVQITAEFSPPEFPLLWRNGKGFLRNPEDRPKVARGRELPTDIITSLSPPLPRFRLPLWRIFMQDRSISLMKPNQKSEWFAAWRCALPCVLLGAAPLCAQAQQTPAKSPAQAQKASSSAKAKKAPLRQTIAARPATVSAATWAKIIALKPGMTRAELLQVFQEEGGVSSRSQRTYLLRGSKGKGPYVKINATFSPDPSPVDWQDAQGLPIIAAPSKTASGERPSDVILSLSPVYWGYMIAD